MINLSDIELNITNISKKYFDVDDKVTFVPSFNLELGDFYSDYLITIAKKLKKSVKEIFDIIYKDIEQNGSIIKKYDIFLIADFINIRLKNFKLSINDVESFNDISKSVLVFIPVLKSYSKSEFFRLSFKGFLHFAILKKFNVKSTLFIGSKDFEVTDVSDVKSFSDSLEEIYDKFITNEDVVSLINEIDSSVSFDLFIVHIGANTFYQRALSKEFFKTAKGQNHFVFRFHTKDWSKVYSEDEHEIKDFLEDFKIDELKSLIFMLASNKDFKEINYHDAKCECEDNFLYFLHETFKRIGKFFSLDDYTNNDFEFFMDDTLRSIALRASLLNSVLSSVILFGNIGDFINYFDMLLIDVNRLLNSPKFRAQIKQGEVLDKYKFVFNYVKVSISRFLNLV